MLSGSMSKVSSVLYLAGKFRGCRHSRYSPNQASKNIHQEALPCSQTNRWKRCALVLCLLQSVPSFREPQNDANASTVTLHGEPVQASVISSSIISADSLRQLLFLHPRPNSLIASAHDQPYPSPTRTPQQQDSPQSHYSDSAHAPPTRPKNETARLSATVR